MGAYLPLGSSSSPSSIYNVAHWNRNDFNNQVALYSGAKEASAIVIDGNSVIRNGAYSVQSISSLPVVVSLTNGSAVLGGALGVGVGLYLARAAALKGRAAYIYNDFEGAAHNALFGLTGFSYAGVSAALTASGITGLAGVSTSASAMMGSFGGLGIIMQTALSFYGAHGWYKTHQFSNTLNHLIENKTNEDVLSWLYNQIDLDAAESRGLSDKEKNAVLQKKWNQFELRVGSAAAKMVREELPKLRKKGTIEALEKLISSVVEANFKEQVKYALLLFIGLLGLAAFIAMIIVAGPLSPALFAIGAAFWLLVDSSKIHNYVAEKCWNWHSENKKQKPPCQIFSPA